MAFRSLVQVQVRSALRLIGDLAVDATLSKVPTSTYDFATSSVTDGTAVESTVRVFISPTTQQGGDTPGYTATALADSSVVGDLRGFDTLNDGVNTWHIGGVEDDGYLTTITLTRTT